MKGWAGCQDRGKRAEVQERGGIEWALGLLLELGGGVGGQDRAIDGSSLSGTPRL